jgi:nucleoside-diphosphate-sugar epimerase
MKKILVCGGSGFIGLNVVKFFKNKNYKIIATYKTKKPKNLYGAKWIKADLTSQKNIKKVIRSCDALIQCAAITSGAKNMVSKPFMFIANNVVMNSLLIKEAVQNKIKHFIFLSCSVMYHHSNRKLKETDYDPRKKLHKVYEGMALTKVYIENMCKFYAERSNTKFSVLRHSNIYGPHDKFENTNSHFMSSVISRSKYASKKLIVWGEGNEKRDFLYIGDFCAAIKNIMNNQKVKFDLINVCYGKAFSVKTIAKKIKIFMGKTYNILFDKKKPSIKINILIDNSKMFKKYKWKPNVPIDNGIKKTVSWYLNNF